MENQYYKQLTLSFGRGRFNHWVQNNFFPISKAKTAGHFGRYQSRGFKADEPISQADVSDWQLDSRLSSIA
jgi:hypothetical protein